MVEHICSFPDETKMVILSPINLDAKGFIKDKLEELVREGFTRVEVGDQIIRIDDEKSRDLLKISGAELRLVIDRFAVSHNDDFISRLGDSVQTAFAEGNGRCFLKIYKEEGQIEETFSNKFERDGIEFEEPTEHLFSFNNPLGACPKCEGYGKIIGIDEDLVIPNKSLSLYEDVIVCWKGESMSWYKEQVIKSADKHGFSNT